MDKLKAQQQHIGGTAVLEKTWDELTDPEKIERMRGIVKTLRQTVDHLASVAYEAQRVATHHAHLPDGATVMRTSDGHVGAGKAETLDRRGDYF